MDTTVQGINCELLGGYGRVVSLYAGQQPLDGVINHMNFTIGEKIEFG